MLKWVGDKAVAILWRAKKVQNKLKLQIIPVTLRQKDCQSKMFSTDNALLSLHLLSPACHISKLNWTKCIDWPVTNEVNSKDNFSKTNALGSSFTCVLFPWKMV